MVRLCWGALVRPCSLELKPSDQVLVLGVTLTSVVHISTSTLPASVRRASTGFANSDGSDVHLDAESAAIYFGPHFCDVTRGLLQRHSCWGIQVHHRQAPASTECSDTQIRPRSRGLSNLLHDELHWLDVPQLV